MKENIVIKREDENLKYIVIEYGYEQISVADLLDEYEKMAGAISLMEAYISKLVKLSKTLKSIRNKYEDSQNA